MKILAIDPGPTESAFVAYDTDTNELERWAKLPNEQLIYQIEIGNRGVHLVIEMIASYGMPVGAEVFETCVWIGRFIDRWQHDAMRPRARRLYRKTVVTHLCGTAKGKDPHVRQALIDRFGPGKDTAIGRKASPGPLYGLSGDGWAALGVAVTYADTVLQDQRSAA